MKHAQDKKINYIQMCTTEIFVFLQLYLLPFFFLKLKVCAFYPWSRGGQTRQALNKLQYLQIVHTCSALSLYEAIIYTQNTRGMHGQRTAPKTWWLHLFCRTSEDLEPFWLKNSQSTDPVLLSHSLTTAHQAAFLSLCPTALFSVNQNL